MTQHLVIKGILAIIPAVNMIVGTLWVLIVAIGTGSPALPNVYFRVYYNGMGLLIWALGAVTLNSIRTEAVDLWVHIQHFDKYVGSVPAEFRNLELEDKAREKLKSISENTVPSP